jgi:hypothetical protein
MAMLLLYSAKKKKKKKKGPSTFSTTEVKSNFFKQW